MKTPQQIAQATLDDLAIKPHWSRSGDQMLKIIQQAIKADRAQREVIPSMYDSSELQGAVDQFNEAASGTDYFSVLTAGERLRDIVDDYLDQVLIHVDRV